MLLALRNGMIYGWLQLSVFFAMFISSIWCKIAIMKPCRHHEIQFSHVLTFTLCLSSYYCIRKCKRVTLHFYLVFLCVYLCVYLVCSCEYLLEGIYLHSFLTTWQNGESKGRANKITGPKTIVLASCPCLTLVDSLWLCKFLFQEEERRGHWI